MAFNKRNKQDVKSKCPLTDGKRKKNGRFRKAAVSVTFKDGSSTVLLTPSGMGAKAAKELKDGVHYTNDLETVKTDVDGVVLPLTDTQRAYRAGILAAQRASAKAFKAKNGGDKK